MNQEMLQRIETHVSQMTYSLISQLNDEGLLTAHEKDYTYGDVISTHHLVDFLLDLEQRSLFDYEISLILKAFQNDMDDSDAPFTLDSHARVFKVEDKNTQFLKDYILSFKVPNNAIVKFTGYMRGGDYFSTLWSLKILLNYSKEVFKEDIESSIEYLLEENNYKGAETKDRGFLCLILLRYDYEKYKENIEQIVVELEEYLNENLLKDNEVYHILDLVYVVEDFLEYAKVTKSDRYDDLIAKSVTKILELESEADHLPVLLEEFGKKAQESMYMQTFARVASMGYKYCKLKGLNTIELRINHHVHSQYQAYKIEYGKSTAELKGYIEIYQSMHKEFRKYKPKLEEIKKITPYEKSVFIMMSFKNNPTNKLITQTIKSACKEMGLIAVRADDTDRRFSNRLWENLLINMLSCKQAIAVHIGERIVDVYDKEVKTFTNPNVALEFGFFLSRGQDVLLLKDDTSPMPSDMIDYLWCPFELDDPEKGIEKAIRERLKPIDKEDKEK